MDVLIRLDEARASINVLEHPFYQRWSAGELSAEELGCYAAESRRAVVALAQAATLAAERAEAPYAEGLRRHAAEESDHVALWDQFARAAGGPGAGGAWPGRDRGVRERVERRRRRAGAPGRAVLDRGGPARDLPDQAGGAERPLRLQRGRAGDRVLRGASPTRRGARQTGPRADRRVDGERPRPRRAGGAHARPCG